jgi:hypothetical protein
LKGERVCRDLAESADLRGATDRSFCKLFGRQDPAQKQTRVALIETRTWR